MGAAGDRPPAPPRGRAPAPRPARLGAASRPADAAPLRRGHGRGGLVPGRGARDHEDPRPGLRVASCRANVTPLVPRLRGPRLRALRRRLAPAPKDLHPGAPQRAPRPLLPPRPPGRAPPPPPLRRLAVGVASGEPDGDHRGLRRGLHRARHHRQPPVQGPRRVPEAVRGPVPHDARAEPAGPVPVLAPRDARQPRARPDQALPPRDAGDHGRRHPGAPGEKSRRGGGGRRRLGRRAPRAPERIGLSASTHHRQHQIRHDRHVRRRQRDGDDGVAVGDGGADAEPEGSAQGGGGGPASTGRPQRGDRGRPRQPPVPTHGRQGDAPAARAGPAADAPAVPQAVPGARVRRARGRHGDRELVGDRQGPRALGRARGVRPGEVRARWREGLQGDGLRVHTVRSGAEDVPRDDVRAGAHRARARGAAVPLRPGAAWRRGRGRAGHDGGGWHHHAEEVRPSRRRRHPCSCTTRVDRCCNFATGMQSN